MEQTRQKVNARCGITFYHSPFQVFNLSGFLNFLNLISG